jgi:hypothetical protein
MKKLSDVISLLIIAAAGFVALRGFGADGEAVASATTGLASALDSLSQYPLFLECLKGAVGFVLAEFGARAGWKTKNPTSLFYFGTVICHGLGVGFFALERCFDYLHQHPFAQRLKPEVASVPAPSELSAALGNQREAAPPKPEVKP